jgi:hypothetical protein
LDIRRDLNTIGGLSSPSKMPCYSYSLPAKACKVGSKLAKLPGTTCHGCYALKGFYMMPNVKAAMDRRLAIVEAASADTLVGTKFTRAFARVLNDKLKYYRGGQRDAKFFRWHDSGDLQSIEHLRLIADIAWRCPDIKFWLPTREIKMVEDYLEANPLFGLPSNLTVRISVPRVDQEVPPAWLKLHTVPNITFSGVHSSADTLSPQYFECPAPKQDHKCQSCRQCWTGVAAVSYRQH